MGKGKKKTVASTKKIVKTPEQLEQERQDKKLLKKLFGRAKKKKSPPKPEIEKEQPKVEEVKPEPVKQVEVKPEPAKLEIVKEKPAKPEKIKKEKKPREPRKPLLNDSQKQKLKGGALVLIGIFILGFSGYFLYIRFFRPESLAHLLPADNTIGFVELNIDGGSDQTKQFTRLFQKYPVYQPANLMQLANLVFPVNYQNDLQPWIGRSIGIALMKQNQNDNTVKPVLFVEDRDSGKALDFLKNRALINANDQLTSEDYKAYKIYSYKLSQNYYFAFINNYLVLAGNSDLLKQLMDTQGASKNKLQDDLTFQKVNNNIPSTGLMFGYANTQKLFNTLLSNPMFQGPKTRDLLAIEPFMNIFAAEGFTLVANDNNLTVQTFEAIDRSQLKGQSYLTYTDKYNGKLLELASPSPVLFTGGHDMYKEINRMGDIFSSETNVDTQLFSGILEAQKNKYFGKDISLQDDIYPLLQNEYLITVDNNFEEPVVSIFMNLSDKNNDTARIEKLAKAFMEKRAIFSPQVKDVTLQDGTKGQEIVASAEEINRTDNSYSGYNVTTLKLGSLPWSINYAVLDNTLVISTNADTLNSIIDRKNGKQPTNLRVSDDFTKNILPVMRTADEIFNIKLGALIPVLGLDQNPAVKPYVEAFDSLTMGKNFFDDGISTLYVINVL